MSATLTNEATATITEPGVYQLTDEEYHADPVAGGSLSSSGARRLLAPSCPAKFRYEQLHGRAPKRVWDLGHAAHKLVLGAGPDLAVIDAENYRTKAAQDAAKEARAAGAVPLLTDEHDQVQAMAAALRAHPLASVLLDPARGGWPEQSLIWRDGPTGIMCRARFDWLPPQGAGRMIVPDYKTCVSADLDALSKAVNQHGYHCQASWYLDGAQALGLAGPDAAFVFICQEKTAPYLITPVELDSTALRIAQIKNRRALQLYAHCTETGNWPAYHEGVAYLSLPRWAEYEYGDQL
jgi:hypothetical protein